MIHVDAFLAFAATLFLALGMYWLGAIIHGGRVKRGALEEKTWILGKTIFKDRLLAELRGLEADARAILIIADKQFYPKGSNHDYWSGKLQAFRDIIVRLGGKIYD